MTQPLSPSRFVTALVFFSVGWLSMLEGVPLPFRLICPLCATIGFLVGMPPSALKRNVPPRELWVSAIILLAFIAIAVVSKLLLPEGTNQKFEALFRRPIILIPPWLFFMAFAYFAWTKRRRLTSTPLPEQ